MADALTVQGNESMGTISIFMAIIAIIIAFFFGIAVGSFWWWWCW